MADMDYVNRVEFEALKEEVKEIKTSMKANSELLIKIDKKVDVISEKISNANNNEEIKLTPLKKDISDLEKKIEKAESNQTWLWRAVVTAVIGAIASLIF